MTKNIMILEMGPLPDELISNYGQYSQFFEKLLADQALSFTTCKIFSGEPLPEVSDADGYVITGSKHGVYENLPWMLATQEFIRQAAKARVPMVGICFGHQIMAQAMGGEVIKSPKGWRLGVNEYQVISDAPVDGLPSTMKLNAVHQDQVVKKPADAEVFATADFCEYAGLVYGGDKPYAITLQPHPEFDQSFTTELLSARRGTSFPEDLSEIAIASQAQALNREDWGKVLTKFLKSEV